MPRPRKTPVPATVPEPGPQIEDPVLAQEAEELRMALAKTTAETNALAEGAKEMLNRIAAEQEAKADEPSGIEVGTDWGFMRADPSDPAPYLAQRDKKPEPGWANAWLNSDKRVIDERIHRGWKPTLGGTVRRGDLVLADRPQVLQDREDAAKRERVKLFESAPTRQLDQVGQKLGMPTFTGNKSAEDGLK